MQHKQPDYAAHDAVYRRLRLRGAEGWSNAAEYDRTLTLLDRLLAHAAPARAPLHILELGCGAGNLALRLAARGHTVTGIDISPTAVQWATESARALDLQHRTHFAVGNVVTLDGIADDTVDLVVDGHCLHCIIGQDRPRCLAAILRVLRPGGALAVLTMCGEPQDPAVLQNFDASTRLVLRDGQPTRYIGTPTQLRDELAAARFTLAHVDIEPRQDSASLDDFLALAIKTGSTTR